MYRIAGNFRWVQMFVIFMDRPAPRKYKPRKSELSYKMEIDDIIMCLCRYKLVPMWTRWFSTVCLPSK